MASHIRNEDSDEEYEFVESPLYERVLEKLMERRIIYLDDEIVSGNIIVPQLMLLDSQDHSEPISIWINSNGGDMYGFFGIYDAMQAIQAPVQTVCWGLAASAAAIILAAGTHGMRIAFPNSYVMIHQVQVGEISGSGTEIEIEAKESKKLNHKLAEILARHTHQPLAKVKRDCEHDKYMDAQTALEYGIIDQIIPAVKGVPVLRTRPPRKKKPPQPPPPSIPPAANNPT